MNVELTIGGRAFAIAPFKMKELRRAAPFIEEMNTLAKRIDEQVKAHEAANAELPEDQRKPFEQNLNDLFALSRAMCEIIAVGLTKIDETLTADWLEEQVDLSYLASLQSASRELLRQSGLSAAKNGKAPSPSPEPGPTPEVSANSSEESLAS